MLPFLLLLTLALGGCATPNGGKLDPQEHGSDDDSGEQDTGGPDSAEAIPDSGPWAALALEGADEELAGSSVAWIGGEVLLRPLRAGPRRRRGH